MEFLQKLEKIEKVVAKYSDRLETQANSLLASHDLTSAKNLKVSLKDLSDTERLMKIGIVGRVKAGKSSLLNAIAFNGKNVLPKAATPMTAALTEIGYGEKFAIEVDFFTKEDIANIKKDSDLYETEFKRITQEKIENLKKNKKYASKSEAELLQDAQRRTTSELSESRMAASKDQYDRIRKSGIDINSLDSHKQVIFDSLEDLQKSLGEYVGSSGKYMPFTRNVKIKFQTDSFKDVNIIDTPGVNDPVVSREQRTRDELGKCDVIFIVSPAGQFMSNEDLDLMDRITHKNGIRELYAVASKVDTQLLMGSIKSDANGDFKVALNRVRSVLAGEMVKRIEGLKESNPEVGDAYDSLLQNGDESVICTSGISTSIKENLNDESKLDEIEAQQKQT
ncbi:dynamin family protein [Helicobacter bilis]|uniref:dynamin family protein n=1 Tax=Helicobacter bilis TaxID=37372 RepID=UPI000CF0FF4C|nr:dynamin family protein [Helicobacter bilis]